MAIFCGDSAIPWVKSYHNCQVYLLNLLLIGREQRIDIVFWLLSVTRSSITGRMLILALINVVLLEAHDFNSWSEVRSWTSTGGCILCASAMLSWGPAIVHLHVKEMTIDLSCSRHVNHFVEREYCGNAEQACSRSWLEENWGRWLGCESERTYASKSLICLWQQRPAKHPRFMLPGIILEKANRLWVQPNIWAFRQRFLAWISSRKEPRPLETILKILF